MPEPMNPAPTTPICATSAMGGTLAVLSGGRLGPPADNPQRVEAAAAGPRAGRAAPEPRAHRPDPRRVERPPDAAARRLATTATSWSRAADASTSPTPRAIACRTPASPSTPSSPTPASSSRSPWSGRILPAGRYRAVAELRYAGRTTRREFGFAISDRQLGQVYRSRPDLDRAGAPHALLRAGRRGVGPGRLHASRPCSSAVPVGAPLTPDGPAMVRAATAIATMALGLALLAPAPSAHAALGAVPNVSNGIFNLDARRHRSRADVHLPAGRCRIPAPTINGGYHLTISAPEPRATAPRTRCAAGVIQSVAATCFSSCARARRLELDRLSAARSPAACPLTFFNAAAGTSLGELQRDPHGARSTSRPTRTPAPTPPRSPRPSSPARSLRRRMWWQEAVVYQIYPRSFADASGDGVGDLDGLRARLDHLQWLGVDAVWLSPFYRSPMADFGYDVADYCDVDPLFGDLAGFDALLAEAHARGIRVLLDWVPNHTSDQHPWFVESRAVARRAQARLVRLARRHARTAARRTTGRRRSAAARRGRGTRPPSSGTCTLPARAARPQLGQPDGRRGDARRAALLARPRRRRLPHRRRPPHRQGPGARRHPPRRHRRQPPRRRRHARLRRHARAPARHPRACSTSTPATA